MTPQPRIVWSRQHYGGKYHLWHLRHAGQAKSKCGTINFSMLRTEDTKGEPQGKICRLCAELTAPV